jgi:hypothetical protein
MVLFTTTLGLYGGVVWSGEFQGFIVHELVPSTAQSRAAKSPPSVMPCSATPGFLGSVGVIASDFAIDERKNLFEVDRLV